MKDYLVDVPVCIMIWTRPEIQKKQFDIIKQARPSKLFLISDGGRNQEEWDAIIRNREMYSNEIDWDCTVFRLYKEENNGLYGIQSQILDFVWSYVDRCIFLEDDIIPSVSFFHFCAELLEKYKDDTRIHVITGMNNMGVSEEVNSDYFFSKTGSIWGYAKWKRTDSIRNLSYGEDSYVLKKILQNSPKRFHKRIIGYSKDKLIGGHIPGPEFWHNTAPYINNQLFIVPKYNMISNIGCDESATHANELKKLPKGIQNMFNKRTYEINRPIIHNHFVVPDENYSEYVRRDLAIGHPFVSFYRKIESIIRQLCYSNHNEIINKIKKKLTQRNKIEE